MELKLAKRLSPLVLLLGGFGATLVGLGIVTVKMAAQASVTRDEFGVLDEQAQSQDPIGDMCARILKDRTDLMDQCRDEETTAMRYVNGYLGSNGLLADDGSIDSLKLTESESDPLAGPDTDPGTVITYCIENSPDWISTRDCINALDGDAAYQALQGGAGPQGGADDPLLGGGAN